MNNLFENELFLRSNYVDNFSLNHPFIYGNKSSIYVDILCQELGPK